jgi:drug/metabolite transporter (DMT)-like permease
VGNLLLFGGVVYLAVVTVAGWSGFVRGDTDVAIAGVLLAVTDGALFTWVLIYCQRLDRAGVGPSAVFGLRFPLYVVVAGSFAVLGFDQKAAIPHLDIATIVVVGLALTIPPLYALQRAVANVSTLTISALTALGPFVIFSLQVVESRVEFSQATLAGLLLYFVGALLSAIGAVRASVRS